MSRNVYIKKSPRLKSGSKPTYMSLFSNAGIGCFGFHEAGFKCVATAELERRRLDIQVANDICDSEAGYVCGDLTHSSVVDRLFDECRKQFGEDFRGELDVLVATPPCQGMSMVNRKKGDETPRNSLVLTSLEVIGVTLPKIFIIENVKLFLSSSCQFDDGRVSTIKDAIWEKLSGAYNIKADVINFFDYGVPSSRTRTLVLGVRRDIQDVTPDTFWPDQEARITVRDAIGGLSELTNIGQCDPTDSLHSFRPYAEHMRDWISVLLEGESAFDNADPERRPHKVVDGQIVQHARGTRDKYRRNYWDKPAACIHTRNDCLASQSTIHPSQDRVFSVRELMVLMTIPSDFKWVGTDTLIRTVIGEAVPTKIFAKIATKVRTVLGDMSNRRGGASCLCINERRDVVRLLQSPDTTVNEVTVRHLAEALNGERNNSAAFYTREDVSFAVIDRLPFFSNRSSIRILEPSVGVGNFLPALAKKYSRISRVEIDCYDIDPVSLEIAQALIERFPLPRNIVVNFHLGDFLALPINKRYDLVVGNPPFGAVKDKDLLRQYKADSALQQQKNIASFFVEKALKVSPNVSFILPKAVVSSGEFTDLRKAFEAFGVRCISDFGDVAFRGVAIETVAIHASAQEEVVVVDSIVDGSVRRHHPSYIFDKQLPNWLLYRDQDFDAILRGLKLNAFIPFRDRTISKRHFGKEGVRVFKARNITRDGLKDIPGYDVWIDDPGTKQGVWEFLDRSDVLMVPNGTYLPRALFKPAGCIVDGSVAILVPKKGVKVTEADIRFFCSLEFQNFYGVARNKGMRSLNIDKSASYFFGVMRKGEDATLVNVANARSISRGVDVLPEKKVA